MMQQILIIGTNINSGKTLKYSLQNDMIRAYYALSLEDAAKHLARYAYHLIIMDIDEPVSELLQSLEVLRKIRLVPILVLSPAGTSEYIENIFTVADDFLQKPFDVKVCRAKIGALLRRPIYTNRQEIPSVLSKDGTLLIEASRRKVYVMDVEVTLQRKQYELLYLLASNEGRVFTRDQLQQNVWGDDFIGSENTLSNQISELRNRLKTVPKAPDYIKTSYGIGYYFDIT